MLVYQINRRSITIEQRHIILTFSEQGKINIPLHKNHSMKAPTLWLQGSTRSFRAVSVAHSSLSQRRIRCSTSSAGESFSPGGSPRSIINRNLHQQLQKTTAEFREAANADPSVTKQVNPHSPQISKLREQKSDMAFLLSGCANCKRLLRRLFSDPRIHVATSAAINSI